MQSSGLPFHDIFNIFVFLVIFWVRIVSGDVID